MLTGVFKSYFNPRGTCIPTLTFILIYTNYILPFFISSKILFFISNSTILIYSSKITLLTSFFILIYIILKPLLFTLINIYFTITNFILFISFLYNNIIFSLFIYINIIFHNSNKSFNNIFLF